MSSDKKKFEIDRRSLLKNILVGTGLGASGALNTFLTTMMVNISQRATAHAAGVDPAFEDMKFISLVMAGGLPRYYWDLPLRPNDNDPFVSNPMVCTKFNSSNQTEYATTKVNGYNMPWLWSGNIPTIGGVTQMSNLAKNMLILRGIDLQIDSHELDRYRQLAPVAGGVSLSGLVADVSNTPIPAVGRNGGGSYYQGEKGIAYLEMGGGKPFVDALSPFTVGANDNLLTLNKAQIESAIDAALYRMQSVSSDKNKYLPSTFSSRFNAKKMMVKSFGDLTQQYTTLVNKYEGLIKRAFGSTGNLALAGVDDLIIPGSMTKEQRIFEGEYYAGESLQSLTNSNSSIAELASGMAIAEFMVINGLSSSINIQSGNFVRLLIDRTVTHSTLSSNNPKFNIRTGTVGFSTDVHFVGKEPAVVLFSRYYKAVSACLFELISRLKETPINGGNLFDKTVMTVTSEFNRLPRTDASGADHGWQGSNFTILSGAIDELTVAGNVKEDTRASVKGTWGLAGGLAELGGREAIIGNAASTVANILEIKTPTPNDMSFTTKSNGKIKLLIKSNKNIAA